MANFLPLKKHLLFCIGNIINQYRLSSPFLDIGCGSGDLSKYLADMEWEGKAIDIYPESINRTLILLGAQGRVRVEKESFFEEEGKFSAVFALDVLEHIENDRRAFEKLSSILTEGGYIVLSLPVHKREWRWDDDFYGHFRRYSLEEIREKLIQTGLRPLLFWDFTFPIFWLLRRLYTSIKRPPVFSAGRLQRTEVSSTVNAWDIPFISTLISNLPFVWKAVSIIQFRYFRHMLHMGHEMIILAKKG